MTVFGITPAEAAEARRMGWPRPKNHWISLHSGVEHNPPPRTERGLRRAQKREQLKQEKAEAKAE